MFITERIVSLLAYAIALFTAYQLIGKIAKHQYKIILILYLLLLAVFAFNYKPYVTADLYRLKEYVEYWMYEDWNGVVSYALKSSTPSWVLYSYIVLKLGNANWLQTITCLWCFGNVFYIIAHEIERHNIEKKYRSELLFYIMAVGAFYLQTISGIRSMLGISIVAFCFYRETIEKKSLNKHFPLWIFAALIHTSTMILVISRFLFLLIQNKGVTKKSLMLVFVAALTLFSFKYFGDYIRNSFEYGKGYLYNTDEYIYAWEIIIGLIEICETSFVLITYRKKAMYNNKSSDVYDYRALYLFTLIWTVICFIALPFSYAIFRRYTILCTVTSLPLVAFLFYIDRNVNKKVVFRALSIFSFLIFVLSIMRGDLCGYKFFVLG